MDSLPNRDQQDLVDAARAVLEREFPTRRILEDDHGRPTETQWRDISTLGWLGLGLGENCGGVGLGPAEEMLLFVELDGI